MQTEEHKILFHELVERNKGILFKVTNAYCPHREDREDLVQEMMIQIWRSIHKYDRRYPASTWLYRIAINVAISFYRKYGARKDGRISIDETHNELGDAANEQEEQLAMLEKFIFELKELDKALMILYLENKSHQETAEILGISISNVGTRIARIKEKLKHRFLQANTFANGRH